MIKLTIASSLILSTIEKLNQLANLLVETKYENEENFKDKTKEENDKINKNFINAIKSLTPLYESFDKFENKIIQIDKITEEGKEEVLNFSFNPKFIKEGVDFLMPNKASCSLLLSTFTLIKKTKIENEKSKKEWKEFKAKWFNIKEKNTNKAIFKDGNYIFFKQEHNNPKTYVLSDKENTVTFDDIVVFHKFNKDLSFDLPSFRLNAFMNDTKVVKDKFPLSLQTSINNLLKEYYKIK